MRLCASCQRWQNVPRYPARAPRAPRAGPRGATADTHTHMDTTETGAATPNTLDRSIRRYTSLHALDTAGTALVPGAQCEILPGEARLLEGEGTVAHICAARSRHGMARNYSRENWMSTYNNGVLLQNMSKARSVLCSSAMSYSNGENGIRIILGLLSTFFLVLPVVGSCLTPPAMMGRTRG